MGSRVSFPARAATRVRTGGPGPCPLDRDGCRACLGRHLLASSHLGRLGRFWEESVDLRGTEHIHGLALDAAERLHQEPLQEVGRNAYGGQSQRFSASRLAAKAKDRVRIIESGQEAPFPDALRRRGKGFTIGEAVPTKGVAELQDGVCILRWSFRPGFQKPSGFRWVPISWGHGDAFDEIHQSSP